MQDGPLSLVMPSLFFRLQVGFEPQTLLVSLIKIAAIRQNGHAGGKYGGPMGRDLMAVGVAAQEPAPVQYDFARPLVLSV